MSGDQRTEGDSVTAEDWIGLDGADSGSGSGSGAERQTVEAAVAVCRIEPSRVGGGLLRRAALSGSMLLKGTRCCIPFRTPIKQSWPTPGSRGRARLRRETARWPRIGLAEDREIIEMVNYSVGCARAGREGSVRGYAGHRPWDGTAPGGHSTASRDAHHARRRRCAAPRIVEAVVHVRRATAADPEHSPLGRGGRAQPVASDICTPAPLWLDGLCSLPSWMR
ncbi:hypothetical protein BC628DRAFT_214065 [Trametes gibbosa]|nr:hypothetical protein BC628DRAFT_214065 [Trametes gibbosa]